MSENPTNVRVILRWIQIKDNKEAPWDEEGEFRFRSRVTTMGNIEEETFPEKGHWVISDHPRRNKIEKLDRVLFDGPVGDTLSVELFGIEIDRFSKDDHLEHYHREYSGPASSWIGRHQPSDEGSDDPENMSDWRICYDIEAV
ncbi:MAG: hypothetical protein J4G12_03605 [Gemmatimonadetes bacterium]|nr:hypothetical protein [Gemmatimonadota bacterium]